MRYIDTYEPPHVEQGCFICGAGPQDSHWSDCPFGSGTADTDPDADSGPNEWE